MEHIVLVASDDIEHYQLDEELAKLGFRRKLSSADKRLAFQLPFCVYASIREGDSLATIRDDVISELGRAGISAFVVVAENYSCGRT